MGIKCYIMDPKNTLWMQFQESTSRKLRMGLRNTFKHLLETYRLQLQDKGEPTQLT